MAKHQIIKSPLHTHFPSSSTNSLRSQARMLLITFCCALQPELSLAQEHRPVAKAFTRTQPKAVPPLRLLRGDPPTAVELRVERPTLLHFWATWCAPCVQELPTLVKAQRALRVEGIDVHLISIDVGGTNKVPQFLAKLGLKDIPVLWDPRSELYKRFAVTMLPTTIAVNARGEEVGRITGAALWSGESDARFLTKSVFR